MAVIYEWDCETIALGDSADFDDGDVIEHNHGPTFAEIALAAQRAPEPGTRFQPVLVRDDARGRSWAYVEDGRLATEFTDAEGLPVAKVPQRFVAEVEAVR